MIRSPDGFLACLSVIPSVSDLLQTLHQFLPKVASVRSHVYVQMLIRFSLIVINHCILIDDLESGLFLVMFVRDRPRFLSVANFIHCRLAAQWSPSVLRFFYAFSLYSIEPFSIGHDPQLFAHLISNVLRSDWFRSRFSHNLGFISMFSCGFVLMEVRPEREWK